MEYTVRKFGEMAGVSPRTLRYYDEIGILRPARINASGYRIYGPEEVDRLQQILFYRELGVDLATIRHIMEAPSFNKIMALKEHRKSLLTKQKQLERLIANVDKTIAAAEGGIAMSDEEKFAGFKEKMLAENEEKYGKEIREKYGETRVEESYQKLRTMTKEQYTEFEKLTAEIKDTLKAALATGDPAGELAQKAAELHRRWLMFTWSDYSKEAHAGLAQMYVEDERFKAYYDKEQPGTAAFLRDAILIYTGYTEKKN